MENNYKNKIQYLLNRHITGKISPPEIDELKDNLPYSGDKELEDALSDLWINYTKEKTPPADCFPEIEKQTTHIYNMAPRRQVSRYIMRIAGILLFIIISGICTFQYRELKEISSSDKQVSFLSAGKGEKVIINLPDGSTVQLNAESSLSYPQSFGRKRREVTLSGEAFFEIKKDTEKQFTVHTEYMDVDVLGTTFNLYAYENENLVEMALVSGQVMITTNFTPSRSIVVNPYEKIVFDKQTGDIQHRKTDTRFETAWTRGEMFFRSSPLQEVLNKLERKFGVDIFTEGESREKGNYNGSFATEQIEDILNILHKHYHFTYKIKDDDVYIRFE